MIGFCSAKIRYVERKLFLLALVLFSLTVFLPWMTENYSTFRFGGRFIHVSASYFPLGVQSNHELITLERFWFSEPRIVSPHHMPLWNGVYNGWGLIFAIQLLTASYCILLLVNIPALERTREKLTYAPAWLVALVLAAIILALYQQFIQAGITLQTISPGYTSQPNIGFWLATTSLAILLILIVTASEQSPLKIVPKYLTATKVWLRRIWPAILVLLVAGFFVLAEVQYQTGASKVIIVGNREEADEIYVNPELWDEDYREITAAASFFRARVVRNSPKYAYCQLDVPVISYGALENVLRNMGYFTHEPVYLHVCA